MKCNAADGLFAKSSDVERWGKRTKDLVWDIQENLKENVSDVIEEITEVTRVSLEKGKEITEEKKKKGT